MLWHALIVDVGGKGDAVVGAVVGVWVCVLALGDG